MNIVYIVGDGRSGSTLFDRMLGQLRGFHSGGELARFWRFGPLENRICSCGYLFEDCPFWCQVTGLAPRLRDRSLAEQAVAFQQKMSGRHAWRLLSRPGRRTVTGSLPSGYLESVRSLYQAVADVTGARTIVDSSKEPGHLAVVGPAWGPSVRVIHLVRDPRAVVYAWSRQPGPDPDGRTAMPRVATVKAALLWDLVNLAAEAVSSDQPSWLRVRYEDLVWNPDAVAGRLRTELGLDVGTVLGERGERMVELPDAHILSGNPMRFHHGQVRVAEDLAWRRLMRRGSAVLAGALSYPLRVRYGYCRSDQLPMDASTRHGGHGALDTGSDGRL